MRVSLNVGTQNTIFQAQQINQSARKNLSQSEAKKAAQMDRVDLSASGKKASRVELLMKQKQNLVDQKNKLMESAKEEYGGIENVQEQMKAFEQQMKELDEKIVQATAEDAMDSVEEKSEGGSVTASVNAPKTEQDLEMKKTAALISQSQGIKQAEIINSAKETARGEAAVLKAEIESGNYNEGDVEQMAELSAKADSLDGKVMKKLAEISTEAAETAEQKALEASETNGSEEETMASGVTALENAEAKVQSEEAVESGTAAQAGAAVQMGAAAQPEDEEE